MSAPLFPPALSHLKDRWSRGKFPHAALFYGPREVGKFRSARALSAFALPEFQEKIEKGLFSDVIMLGDLWQEGVLEDFGKISKTSNFSQRHRVEEKKKTNTIGREDVEVLQEAISRTTNAPARFVLIRDADRMTAEAANALLKTLEEPPEKTFFILTALHPKSLPETIPSRCQSFFFSLFPRDLLEQYLQERHLPEDLRETLILLAQGRSEVLMRLLDDEEYFQEEEASFQDIVRWFSAATLPEKLKKAELLSRPESAAEAGHFLENMTRCARSLLLQKIHSPQNFSLNISPETLLSVFDALERSEMALSANVNKRLLFEQLFLALPNTV